MSRSTRIQGEGREDSLICPDSENPLGDSPLTRPIHPLNRLTPGQIHARVCLLLGITLGITLNLVLAQVVAQMIHRYPQKSRQKNARVTI